MAGLRKPAQRIVFGVRFAEALRDVLDGIGTYVKQQECNWIVECVDPDEFARTLQPGEASGAITVISPVASRVLTRVLKTGIPTVNLFHNCHPRLPSVLSDDRQIGSDAAQYLLRHGFQAFGYVGINTGWSRDRCKGFEQAVIASSHPCHISPTCQTVADYHFMETRQAVRVLRRWVATLPKPVAIMGCSDMVVRTLLSACDAAGLRVPEDAAMLGVDNRVALCELARVPISSIKQDFARLGFEAARLLDRTMRSRRPPVGPVLIRPCGVAARRSTDVLAFEDEHITAAMRLIHQHGVSGMSIKELLRSIPVSRKWLDLKFKELIGHTPREEIHKLRLTHIRELLLNTDLSIREIARRCNFSNPENLIRFFRNAQGIPPQRFREQQWAYLIPDAIFNQAAGMAQKKGAQKAAQQINARK
jgi:LacI family transcriptional regulator